MNPAIGRLLFR